MLNMFEQYLNENSEKFNLYLDTFFNVDVHPDMLRYLYRPLRKFSDNAGKRHRPLICLLATSAVGGDAKKALSAAASIEHFHTAALIHDDIADESLLRRNVPCMYITEGIGLAVNAGDLALSLVNGTVLKDPALSPLIKLRILTELIDMTARTVEGQALDLGWARDERYDISVEDYIIMATHKTAFYSGGMPLAIGAIIGEAPEETVESLRQYGMDTGLAFQIQDDILNLVGDAEVANKDFQSDITEGKRTLVAVHAMNHAQEREELISILSAHTTDRALMSRAVEIMQNAGSIEYANEYAQKLVDNAKKALRSLDLKEKEKNLLLDMADFLINRSL
ncbi:MAG: polyprenyl synthetase family protein [Coriobacteriia bacterium]|nr:polyprenyl synthetase family protein [Coriobacteriia bacterium]